jgi:hypothetical protein
MVFFLHLADMTGLQTTVVIDETLGNAEKGAANSTSSWIVLVIAIHLPRV